MTLDFDETNHGTEKYLITKSNLKKMIQDSSINIEEDIITMFRTIYSDEDLQPYLNKVEAKEIRKISEFLLDPEKYASMLKKQKSLQEAKSSSLKSNYIFVSSSMKPKYHKDSECKTLYNAFENFKIPDEIKERGSKEIERFRAFAKENRSLLKHGKENLFIQELKKEFNLTSDIQKVLFDNSGKVQVNKIPTHNIKENVLDLIKKVEEIRASEEGRESIKKYMFIPKNRMKAVLNDSTLSLLNKNIIEIKDKLLDLIIEFNLRKSTSGLSISEEILELYGFEKCGVCFADEITFDL